jgi:hypothetical protein
MEKYSESKIHHQEDIVEYLKKNGCMYTEKILYSERQKYGINSLKIKQNFFFLNPSTGQF